MARVTKKAEIMLAGTVFLVGVILLLAAPYLGVWLQVRALRYYGLDPASAGALLGGFIAAYQILGAILCCLSGADLLLLRAQSGRAEK